MSATDGVAISARPRPGDGHEAAAEAAHRGPGPGVWLPPAVATLTACLIGIGHPVLWQDELATASAVRRSLPELVRLAEHRDPVLAPYYAVLHVWTLVFGTSPVSLRLPSALAMAAAAAVVALLGARLSGPRAGLTAGLLCAVVPDVSRYGQEARPYALTFLAAGVSTLLLLRALERPEARRWAWYGLGVVALGVLQLTSVVLVGAHAVAVLLVWRRDRDRLVPRGWLVATAAAFVLLVPVAVVGALSSWQLNDTVRTTWAVLPTLPDRLLIDPAVTGLLVGAGVFAAFRRGVAGWLGLAIATVPVAALVLVSLWMPLLRPRYLLFALLGWLLLAGAASAGAGRREAVALVVAVAVLGLQTQIDIRGTTRSEDPDYPAIARVLAAQTRPGDAIVVPVDRGVRFRIGLEVYLPRFLPEARWPDDVLAVETATHAGRLDAVQCKPAVCIGPVRRLWVGCLHSCSDPLAALPAETAALLRARHYTPERVWRVSGGGIALYTLP